MKKIILLLIIIIFLLETVSAIGIGVTPGNLNFSTQVGLSDSRSLYIINTGTEISNYKVYVDEDYANWFHISPDNFSLNANENKEVILKFTPPISSKGDFDFTVYSVSSSPSSDFSVGSGIKVPVQATVFNSGIIVAGLILVLLIIGTGGYCIYRKKGRNNQ